MPLRSVWRVIHLHLHWHHHLGHGVLLLVHHCHGIFCVHRAPFPVCTLSVHVWDPVPTLCLQVLYVAVWRQLKYVPLTRTKRIIMRIKEKEKRRKILLYDAFCRGWIAHENLLGEAAQHISN